MSKLARRGITLFLLLALVAAAVLYFRGQKKKALICTVEYPQVEGLAKAAAIYYRGVEIGKVIDLRVKDGNLGLSDGKLEDSTRIMVATLRINKDLGFPKNTVAAIAPGGSLIDGNVVVLEFDELCKGGGCLEDGDLLKGRRIGMVEATFEGDPDDYAKEAKENVEDLIAKAKAKFLNPEGGNLVADAVRDMNASLASLKKAQAELKSFQTGTAGSQANLKADLKSLSNLMAANSNEIKQVMNNVKALDQQLKDLDTKTAMAHSKATMATANRLSADAGTLMKEAKQSAADMNQTLADFSKLMAEMKDGDNSASYIMNQTDGLQKDMTDALGTFNNLNDNFKNKPYLYKPWPLKDSRRGRYYRKKERRDTTGK